MEMDLVRDVLFLSKVVQVKGGWVRMNDWERYVLPDAAASDVEGTGYEHDETYAQHHEEQEGEYVHTHSEGYAHGDVHKYGEPSSDDNTCDDSPPAGDAGREGEQDGDVNGNAEEDIEDECEDEDDEEDVVFVMSRDDDGQPWPPERFTCS